MGSWSTSGESAVGIRAADSEVQNPASVDHSKPLLGSGGWSNVHRSPDDDAHINVPKAGEFAKSIVYGGLDAIVTSFALIASISGATFLQIISAALVMYLNKTFNILHTGAALVLGFSNLIADGISMGFGDFVSSSTERDLAFTYRKATGWKVHKDPHSQILDLISTYKAHGMHENDAETVVECFSKYQNLLLDQKMTMEQGIVNPDPSERLWKLGCVTFLSFIGFGCTPLLAYVILNPFTSNSQLKFGAACAVTVIALIVLGLAKAIISGQKYWSSVLMVLPNGGIAAGVAYLVGWLLTDVLGIED